MAHGGRIRVLKSLTVIAAIFVTGMSSCRQAEPKPEAKSESESQPATAALTDVAATLKRFPIDAETFLLIPEAHPDERYLPDDLPEAFREDGLRVLFSGELREILPNERLIGTPIRLLRIERRDGTRRS